MWIHQRTGPNSGFSISGTELLIILLIAGTVLASAWPAAVVLAVIYGLVAWANRRAVKHGARAAQPDTAGPLARNFYRRMDGPDSEFI